MKYVNLSFQFKMKKKERIYHADSNWILRNVAGVRFNLSNDGFDFKHWPLDPKS